MDSYKLGSGCTLESSIYSWFHLNVKEICSGFFDVVWCIGPLEYTSRCRWHFLPLWGLCSLVTYSLALSL